MTTQVHIFDNGVRVYEHQLLDAQKERYEVCNIHEIEEEPIFLEAARSIESNSAYVNIGAAIGYYPLLIRSLRSDLRIVAYEPLKMHRNYFRKNIELNGYKLSDFKIYDEGVFSKNGSESFSINHYGSMIEKKIASSGVFNKLVARLKNKRIKTVTLEKLCGRIKEDIGLVQMDIQGLELDVLSSSQGLLRTHVVKRFIIGTHSEDIHKTCKDILKDCGYIIKVDNFNTSLQPDGILMAELAK